MIIGRRRKLSLTHLPITRRASWRSACVSEIPSAAAPPGGCVFHTRCPRRLASGVCETTAPPVLVADDGGPPDEVAAGEPPLRELVDDVVGDLTLTASKA